MPTADESSDASSEENVLRRLRERAGKQLQLAATARTPNGKTAATCTATCRIL